jgi:hypothetical protein
MNEYLIWALQGAAIGGVVGGLLAGYNVATRPQPKKAINELKATANTFVGLYEPLYMIKMGILKHSHGVFADFGTRIENMDNAPNLQQYWSKRYSGFEGFNEGKARKKAGELLLFIQRTGTKRSKEKQTTVNQNTFRCYNSKDGERLEPNTVVKVLQPYWAMDETILEKGLVTK